MALGCHSMATGDTVVTLSRSGVTRRYYSGTRIALETPESTVVALR